MNDENGDVNRVLHKWQRIGPYRVIERLDHEQFAERYLVQGAQDATSRIMDLFLPALPDELKEPFLAQAHTLMSLKHLHILPLQDAGVEKVYSYLVSDYVLHMTLRVAYPRGSRLSLTKLLPFLKQLASALQYAHDQRIWHGDIRPENVLLSQENRVLLRGFTVPAIVQNRERLHYHLTDVMGQAIAYAAPEQLQGQGSPASDQYSLAIMIYELLSGKVPFAGSAAEIAEQHLHATPSSLHQRVSDITAETDQAIARGLAKDPAQRFATVEEFINGLEQEPRAAVDVEHQPTQPRRPAIEQSPLAPRRHEGGPVTRRVFAGSLIGLAALGGLGGWYALSKKLAQPTLSNGAAVGVVAATHATINGRSVLLFTGHQASVNALAWSPDGTQLASASDDASVQIFEARSGLRKVIYSEHTDGVTGVSWAVNGQHIASGSQDGTAQVWDAASGKKLFTYKRHRDRVTAVAWSGAGHLIASGSEDRTVQVWNGLTGALSFNFQGHSAGVLCVGWQPGNSSVASGSWDGSLRDWAIFQHGTHFAAGEQIFNYDGHGKGEVYALSWSPDGNMIASAGADQTVQISNGVDGTAVPPFFTAHQNHTHINAVRALDWSPDGKLIASGDGDGNVYVWQVADHRIVFRYQGHKEAINAVRWSPDGKSIASASADTTVHVWQPA